MASSAVSATQVTAGIGRLGLRATPVCLHASLRSFPALAEGPATLVEGILDAGGTVMVATMANQAFEIPAPPGDRPARNGVDYNRQDRTTQIWPGQNDHFDVTRTEVDPWLGATSAYVAALPGRRRCRFAPGSFSAVGPLAGDLIDAEVAADTFGPLRELADRSGWVLLAGVGLIRMTLLHLAETEAGRRPFVRWARGPDGRPVRNRSGGCSKGFEHLAGVLAPIERRATVGSSLWRAFPAQEAVELAAEAIGNDPSITRCADPGCPECPDAVAGGPIDR
jgi:aminoglycoside 3-N-acetyltransferase